MKRKSAVRLIALTLTASVLCSTFLPIGEVSAQTESTGQATATYSSEDGYVNEMLSENYTKISAGYTAGQYKGEDVLIKAADNVVDLGTAEIVSDTREYSQAASVVDMQLGDTVKLTVKVPETAQYYLGFDYLSYDDSVLPVGLSMTVDGEFPFYECRNLEFETTWIQIGETSVDRYGNEIVMVPDKLIQWERKFLSDGSYRRSLPLCLELEAGTHEIELNVQEGNFLLGGLVLSAPVEIPAYTGSQAASGSELIPIQAEEFTYRNDSAVHAIAEYDTSLEPYEVKDTVLNTIDSDSFASAGQKVTYSFNVEKAGYYYIGMNYRQSDKTDFPVFLNVEIDGEIPNTEFESYPMEYTNKYKVHTLQDDEKNNLSVYLEEGEHTVSFTISIDNIRHILEELDLIMSRINDLSLEITKVAGTNMDKYRDLKLSRYIPDIEDQLRGYAQQLYDLQDSVLQYVDDDSVAILSSMSIAAKQLISLAEEPDEIPYRVGELCTSASSANRHLANTVDKLIQNNLAIDRIYIYQEDAKVPKKPNIFKSAGMNISRFFSSFTDQAYSTNNTDPDHLQVWVNRSSQYVQIMQKMIDEYFTPQTGIEVDISIMPDQYKLVLANSSGNAPDVATGINYTVPYELAIRGALADMTQFDDFQQVAEPYEEGFFLTATINDGVYAMPETMNFWVLFYRSDILDKLGLEVPNTMQDVIDMLPELQMRGLNYYQPVSGMLAMRNFHGTTPLIHQYGGSLYSETAQEGTAFGSAEAIDGFTFLTDLFTIYNMPINIDNFYQHFRNGDMPIGVADYAVYNLMTNAAPELKNSWEIALVPGVEQADGTVDRTTCGNAESCVIFKSDTSREAQAWEFVKWWSSTEVQAEFGQTLQITYGSEYMWTTANMEAFMQLPWDSQDKQTIREQMAEVIDVARVPGTYLLEREISNAFNDIVVNGDTAQMRIDKAVKTINREIDRKLEEFEYIDSDGNTVEEYRIPTIDSIRELLGREDEE
ncbi:MAG: extracellular solute-binding protein [Lachnospiraceae bacterium]|nr:extracellular solute-binding protein [Lachnospiraceae bacterium]